MDIYKKISDAVGAIRSGARDVVRKSGVPFSSSLFGVFTNNSGNGFFRRDNYLDEYKNWPYACITARAESVGDIKLLLYKGDKIVTQHEALTLLDQVNPYMTRHELFEATQSYLDLDGNAFWYLARDGKENGTGKIREIYVLRPDKVLVVPSKDNPLEVKGYIYIQPDGTRVPFEPTEILHHRNFNPLGNHPFPHRGMGVVQAAHWAIDTDNEIRTWNFNFFKNSARPDGILEYSGEGSLDPDEHSRLTEQWNQKHKGSENAHKTSIIGGGLTWKAVTATQTEMQFSEQRVFSRDEILALFRVPKSIIGITDDVNRANADAAIYVFNLRTVKPLMQKLVDRLNEFYLPNFGDGLRFDFISPVPEDKVTASAYYAAAINKWMTRNEIRAAEGLPLLEEGGDVMYGGFADVEQVTAPTPNTQKAVENPVEKVDKPKPPQSAAEKAVADFVAKMPPVERKRKTLTPEQKDAYVAMWKAHIDVSTKPLEKRLVTYFSKQEAEVQKNLRRELKGLNPTEFRFKGISDIVFDEDEAVRAGISLITPFIEDYINRSGAEAAKLTGQAFDDTTAKIEKFKKQRAALFSESINDTTKDKILSQVQDGIEAQESVDDISKRVSSVFEEAKTSRTLMIARTEVSASSNFGATEAYQQAGVEKHEWKVVDPLDEDCIENEGVEVKIGEPFPSGAINPPDPHPNCVCTTLPIF